MFDRLTKRLLALVGLDVDFSIDMRGEPFHLIDESVYVGSCPTPERVPQLEAAGITHVVSCLREDERAQVAFLSEHFHVLFLPMHDGMHEDIAAVFPAFFDFASVVESTPGARLLVHCQAGVSRSGTLATALHMRSQRRSFFDAVTHVRTKRPAVLPNIGFASQLQALEHTLRPDARPLGCHRRWRATSVKCAASPRRSTSFRTCWSGTTTMLRRPFGRSSAVRYPASSRAFATDERGDGTTASPDCAPVLRSTAG
ncbi:MAG: dual specificity protein phosphatase family protein [Sandaracinaceae bacterium]|nr:dual specificity protein phosphatase family protein [Sandaracinaceae bacterium]